MRLFTPLPNGCLLRNMLENCVRTILHLLFSLPCRSRRDAGSLISTSRVKRQKGFSGQAVKFLLHHLTPVLGDFGRTCTRITAVSSSKHVATSSSRLRSPAVLIQGSQSAQPPSSQVRCRYAGSMLLNSNGEEVVGEVTGWVPSGGAPIYK